MVVCAWEFGESWGYDLILFGARRWAMRERKKREGGKREVERGNKEIL